MKVLLVEDDAALGAEIAKALRAENFALDHARDGEDAQHLGETEDYDAVVLDLGLPKCDGVSVLQAWRAGGRTLPVLILTARDGWSDKVAGFKAGADDYLVKPFRTEELVIRLRALVRRSQASGASRLVCGPLSFDPGLGAFERDGLPLKLTGLEWRVLSCLMLRKDAVVPRSQLIERVYDGDADVDSNSVEVIITRLRRKIAPAQIEAVRGHGWRLHADAA
ncbi:Transcriptional regulatory protein BasR [Methylobacterium cerastii]|uniref:Transcriptional regulatory protein BasR n=1 Tax=Methylobacterium cerastii TaxID=932741 RepID=A0ABQ4QD28_9HYPH|nr:response regulator transcription factor [Methylobacterium cerastii]GJD43078.1 Transcriptional regulatory protein BasR [Methylobacterium cerastii]